MIWMLYYLLAGTVVAAIQLVLVFIAVRAGLKPTKTSDLVKYSVLTALLWPYAVIYIVSGVAAGLRQKMRGISTVRETATAGPSTPAHVLLRGSAMKCGRCGAYHGVLHGSDGKMVGRCEHKHDTEEEALQCTMQAAIRMHGEVKSVSGGDQVVH